MTGMLSPCVLALVLLQNPLADRPRHPLAPSLPQLTEKEVAAIERIIDRLIEYDIGKLKGKDGEKAYNDFKALGPEAIPHLVEGLNKAANLESSCPAVLIAKKLAPMLNASRDKELLDFVRETIGADVKAKRHLGTLQDLRLTCQLRKSALQREELLARQIGVGAQKGAKAMTLDELLAAANSERGQRAKEILIELETRPSEKVVPALVAATKHYDADIKQLGQTLLVRNLAQLKVDQVKDRLKDERPAVREAAARAVGQKKYRLGGELIALLEDVQPDVRQAARQALVQLSSGQDFGPAVGASESERADSVRRWRAWWEKNAAR